MENLKHKHKEGVIVVLENNELKIKSIELVEIINEFRKLESNIIGKNYIELAHKDFLKKIRQEVETLISLGVGGERNFSPSSYVNSQNKTQPCFELNRDGMLQMLNSESTLVRYKTIEYINKLESQIKGQASTQPKQLSPMEQLRLQYQVIEEHGNTLELHGNNFNIVFNKIDSINEKLESSEISSRQRKVIQKVKSDKVKLLLGGRFSAAYKDSSFRSRVYAEMGRAYNNYFDIPSYDCTPKNRFKEALEVIESYNLSTELNMELKRINNQINFKDAV